MLGMILNYTKFRHLGIISESFSLIVAILPLLFNEVFASLILTHKKIYIAIVRPLLFLVALCIIFILCFTGRKGCEVLQKVYVSPKHMKNKTKKRK